MVPWSPWAPALVWRERGQVEDDPTWQQPVIYAVLRDGDGRCWAYQRRGGDSRLDGRRSIGVGGHVDGGDDRGELLPTMLAALARELDEELTDLPGGLRLGAPLAWINEQASAVGRVHVGLVIAAAWPKGPPPSPRAGEALDAIGFVPVSAIRAVAGYEVWSVLAATAVSEHA